MTIATLYVSSDVTSFPTLVVDVGGDQGGGGVHGGPHVLRYVIDFRSAMLCNKIGDRVYNVLR